MFRRRVKKKYCCVRGGHYMKNKNIEGCVLSAQPDQQKRPRCKKCATNAKNYQILKNVCSLVSLTRHFTKFIFLEQLTAMPQFNMHFFLSSHHDTNPLLHLYHFRKKDIIIYRLILTVNHQGSYFPFFFFFFVFIQWVKHFCTPSKFCNHLKHSAK